MTLCILLLTKDRREYAERTLRAVLAFGQTKQPLRVHIADDGSQPGHVGHLADIASAFDVPVTISETGGHSYGRSYNLALQTVHDFAEYVLPLEDDWELTRELDFDRYIAILDTGFVGCVRMGYLGWTQPLVARIDRFAGVGGLLFDPDSMERHVWAGHPRLESRKWQRSVGPWPEGLDAGTTEFDVAGLAARHAVFWPLEFGEAGPFAHIGTVQARKDQAPK